MTPDYCREMSCFGSLHLCLGALLECTECYGELGGVPTGLKREPGSVPVLCLPDREQIFY